MYSNRGAARAALLPSRRGRSRRRVSLRRAAGLDQRQQAVPGQGPWGPPGARVGLKRREGTEGLEVIWRSGESTGFHGFDFADVDGDGDLDVAAADWAGRSVSIFLQDDGRLASEPAWTAATGSPAHEVEFADIDGDGDLDLAAGCLAQAMVYLNEARR